MKAKWHINHYSYRCEDCGWKAPVLKTWTYTVNEGYEWAETVDFTLCPPCVVRGRVREAVCPIKRFWRALAFALRLAIKLRKPRAIIPVTMLHYKVTQNAIQLKHLSKRIGPATDAEVLAQWDRLVQSIDKLADIVREGA